VNRPKNPKKNHLESSFQHPVHKNKSFLINENWLPLRGFIFKETPDGAVWDFAYLVKTYLASARKAKTRSVTPPPSLSQEASTTRRGVARGRKNRKMSRIAPKIPNIPIRSFIENEAAERHKTLTKPPPLQANSQFHKKLPIFSDIFSALLAFFGFNFLKSFSRD